MKVLLIALVLCYTGTYAQEMPSYLSRDPEYWYRLYESQRESYESLAKDSNTAVDGLQKALKAANDTITRQNTRLRELATYANKQSDRGDGLAMKLAISEGDKPKTWLGKLWRRAEPGLAVFGVVLGTVGAVRFVK